MGASTGTISLSEHNKKAALKPNIYIGKYRLKKAIDSGGSCEVWQARDTIEGIWVAIKIPLVGVNGQRDNGPLLREIKAVSNLRHPNILSIKNADIINGHAVLVTELSTRTLADCTKPMSVARIISIVSNVLKGLAYAHNQRIVHCDVSPSNIFLFADNRAAIGDFGISLKLKGRIRTADDYGTPGYVAPEQAYGYPTFRSDCFSVGLILYEYITGVLPRWPFNWPCKGHERFREKTGAAFVKFIKRALSVDPKNRFTNAGKMLAAMTESLPKNLQTRIVRHTSTEKNDWKKVRRRLFIRKYRRIFPALFRCVECDEPIAETMQICPWCGSTKNRFDTRSQFSHICRRCHRGVLPEWQYCPWCYGPGFAPQDYEQSIKIIYHDRCKYCHGKLMRFMRYCPWCRRKVKQTWDIRPFPEICNKCRRPVDSEFWSYCPWCKTKLVTL